jgi:hypothetical protein
MVALQAFKHIKRKSEVLFPLDFAHHSLRTLHPLLREVLTYLLHDSTTRSTLPKANINHYITCAPQHVRSYTHFGHDSADHFLVCLPHKTTRPDCSHCQTSFSQEFVSMLPTKNPLRGPKNGCEQSASPASSFILQPLRNLQCDSSQNFTLCLANKVSRNLSIYASTKSLHLMSRRLSFILTA